MSLKDELTFEGSVATQILRNQHRETVEIVEDFLSNSINFLMFMDHINELLKGHFVLEETILFPVFKPVLAKYMEFAEPIRLLTGEHRSIANLYHSVQKEEQEEPKIGVLTRVGRILLQHIYKEENGLFGLIDRYMPVDMKESTARNLQQKLDELSGSIV